MFVRKIIEENPSKILNTNVIITMLMLQSVRLSLQKKHGNMRAQCHKDALIAVFTPLASYMWATKKDLLLSKKEIEGRKKCFCKARNRTILFYWDLINNIPCDRAMYEMSGLMDFDELNNAKKTNLINAPSHNYIKSNEIKLWNY